jgi:membrane-associated phospholipid phosphatase
VNLHSYRWLLRTSAALLICITRVAAAQTAGSEPKTPPFSGFLTDVKDYVTAPVRWDATDWMYFGGTIAAIAAAHHYDDQVRRHFTIGPYAGNLTSSSTHDLQDVAPAVAAVGATWLYAGLVRDSNGQRETGEMLEAGMLGTVAAYAMKFAVRREGPEDTADSSKFGGGSNSFPSFHSTLAFSVGTVLAESGSDDVRWIRRLLGYGLGAVTSYERLKHNAHWLSDTVAGAALGISTAHFVMNRHGASLPSAARINVIPLNGGGAMLTYSTTLP